MTGSINHSKVITGCKHYVQVPKKYTLAFSMINYKFIPCKCYIDPMNNHLVINIPVSKLLDEELLKGLIERMERIVGIMEPPPIVITEPPSPITLTKPDMLPTLPIQDHPINHWGHDNVTENNCEECKVTF